MQKRLREARENRDAGFTLIELLIVIVVLGILATIVVFGVAQFRDDADTAACEANLKTIEVAADAYEAKNSTRPGSVTVLVTDGYLKAEPTPAPGSLNLSDGDAGNEVTGSC